VLVGMRGHPGSKSGFPRRMHDETSTSSSTFLMARSLAGVLFIVLDMATELYYHLFVSTVFHGAGRSVYLVYGLAIANCTGYRLRHRRHATFTKQYYYSFVSTVFHGVRPGALRAQHMIYSGYP